MLRHILYNKGKIICHSTNDQLLSSTNKDFISACVWRLLRKYLSVCVRTINEKVTLTCIVLGLSDHLIQISIEDRIKEWDFFNFIYSILDKTCLNHIMFAVELEKMFFLLQTRMISLKLHWYSMFIKHLF